MQLNPPNVPPEFVPRHVAIVMDGNGRWAEQRGLKRTEGHKRGEAVLLDMVAACQAMGIPYLSAYAFSTENWRRSAEEVRFLMGFNRDVLARQKMWMHERNVKVRWVGRRPRLWRSVIKELEAAEELTKNNTGLTLYMCVNYGGRAEIIDGVKEIAQQVQAGKLKPEEITEKNFQTFLDEPAMPPVDLFLRPSGEQRISNFLIWQSAYAELVFQNTLFPDYTPQHLFDAVVEYAKRDRRFGGAK